MSKKFEPGKVYVARGAYGYEDRYQILRRTKCYVTTNRGRFKIRISEIYNGEEFFPVGNYSMAPTVWASEEYDICKAEQYVTDYERAMRMS